MDASRTFPRNTKLRARLVAMDIVGFSSQPDDLASLLCYRTALIRAVEQTTLFAEAIEPGAAAVQLLGDELRLAFPAHDFSYERVLSCVVAVHQQLAEQAVALRSVVLSGSLRYGERRGGCYLAGGLMLKAQRWLSAGLDGGALASDVRFTSAEQERLARDVAFVRRGLGATATAAAPLAGEPVPGQRHHFVVAVGLRPPTGDTERVLDLVERPLHRPGLQGAAPSSSSLSVAPHGVLVSLPEGDCAAVKALVEGVRVAAAEVQPVGVAAAVSAGYLSETKLPWTGGDAASCEGPAVVRAARILAGIGPGVLALSEEVVDRWGADECFSKSRIRGLHREELPVRQWAGWCPAPAAQRWLS